MDTSMNSPPHDRDDSTAAFRKPSNDGSSRKYRRRALADDGSSSSGGSLERNQSPDSKHPRGDVRKVSDKQETDRYERGGFDSHRHDRYSRDDKYGSKRDEYNRHERDGPRSGSDTRGGHHSDRRRVESEYSRSRNDSDRHSRDKHKSSRQSHDGIEKAEDLSSGRRHREPRFGDKERDRDCKEEKKGSRWSFGDPEINKEKDVHVKSRRDRYDEKGLATENRDTHSKKMKGFISEKVTHGNTNAEEKQSSSLNPAHSKQTENSGDVNAARVAAMQAAQLVNKNLVGTGFLTTDQKKKLLWGKKKSAVAEESTAHRWDSALVGDRERQEKFNKLMGVKGSVVVNQEQNQSEVDVEKQKELQMDLEKQYTAGLRRRDGRTVGLGL